MQRKVKCSERSCGWHGTEAEVLTAPNPFDPADTLTGCPQCKGLETVIYACDEPGCRAAASCGTVTPDGYRSTCGEHVPSAPEAAAAAPRA